ncbi:MAG: NADH-quinone oxidoreductase subunit NuoG [Buchnera aphidicola (Periphyllus lyropictus)]|uniref:NADH-quinone oxidoreductase subunit NuoG n=1 Tax=Buchnera aphidicola TaxID=9 RepID=UPI001EB77F08|nr:NADH-quinone oxidoreductase subunit NuoG [Buchnera aphidicola]NIH16686.1 NADH-quinone oxidoreductase subunit NuoG [Buchnera aphidicola (Periphyllus lyropictus)]USS94593.1 NADH-quinone oxidoreductase subunit NuoG [Buchnera aphidicola (Periphyllus lyropictus)]
MVKIYIDGKKYRVNPLNNLLQEFLNLGLDVPYFCWHPKLGSVGFCRQCAVKKYQNKEDINGRIVMSCMTFAEKNSIITINDNESKIFRKNIIELLMTNHPHDCPVCEEGGNCHLQDMTVMTQHFSRRYRFKKKKYNSQYLGFFLSHEMNRCISCYRCVRYYRDYADGKDFNVYGSNNNIYFGRFQDGELKSEYSGNLIEVCPTGVFTDKTHSKNYSRKWDIQNAPSICIHCSVGCNIIAGERYNKIRRIENRYHKNINNYFLCDLGRFGYGYSNVSNRPKYLYKKNNNKFQDINKFKSIKKFFKIIQNSSLVVGIGSSRASIETNVALQELVGVDNFSSGMIDIDKKCTSLILKILKKGNIKVPSLKEVESYDSIFILGEDITQTSSRLALSIRQALKKISKNLLNFNNLPYWHTSAINNFKKIKKNFLFITNTDKTKLEDISDFSYEANPEDQAYFGYCISENLIKNYSHSNNLNDYLKKKSLYISKILLKSKKILIVSGSHSRNLSIIKSSYNIAYNLKKLGLEVGLVLLTPTVNSMGLEILNGKSLEKIFKKVKKKKNSTLIVVENDLFLSFPKIYLNFILEKFKKIIVLDHQLTKTVKKADLVIPVTNVFESSGTFVNYELRAQRFFQVYDINFYNKKNSIISSWKFLNIIKSKLDKNSLLINNLDNMIDFCIYKFPIFKNIKKSAPNSSFKVFGQKIPRSSHRSSGRTSLRADIDVHEIQSIKDTDTMFSFSMEGSLVYKKFSSCIPFIWSPQWNSSQGWHKFQKEVNGNLLSGNPGKILKFVNNKSKLNYFKIFFKHYIIKNKFFITPYYKLFKNEELSQYSKIIRKKNKKNYMIINKIDARKLKISNKSRVSFTCLNEIYNFYIKYSNHLALGQIALPIGNFKTSIFLIGKEIKDLKEV